MEFDSKFFTLCGIIALFSAANIICLRKQRFKTLHGSVNFIWLNLLILLISAAVSFRLATWLWGFLSFFILREYFSLVDFRLQDRFGIAAAYLSIPFMLHYVHTGWYGMFIISIPVYSFLIVPFLVALRGGSSEGAVNSIGIIILGLFLFVYCLGHVAYLSFLNLWVSVLFLLGVFVCDLIRSVIRKKGFSGKTSLIMRFGFAVPVTVFLFLIAGPWTGMPRLHSAIIGLMIPPLVIIGAFTFEYLEADLVFAQGADNLRKNVLIGNSRSLLYTAPVIFHYYRYFIGE